MLLRKLEMQKRFLSGKRNTGLNVGRTGTEEGDVLHENRKQPFSDGVSDETKGNDKNKTEYDADHRQFPCPDDE